jgi:outer membrane biosynthesis protein TonB
MSTSTSPNSSRRLLRVGIVHGRRIVEERLLPRAGKVTIGSSPRNTFIVPWDDAPDRWRLFEEHGGRHTLHLARDMTARIADGTTVTSIDGGAPRSPIPLSDRARGKVTVGGTTVLFQLLRPPAPQPRAQLPLSVRRRVSREIDGWFALALAFTALLHLAFVVYLRQVDWPRRPSLEEIPDRFIRQMIQRPRPTPAPAAPTAIAEHTPRPHPAPAAARPKPGKPQKPALPDISNIGLMPLLTAHGPDGSSALKDVLSPGGIERSLDEAMRDVGNIGIAGTDQLKGLHGPGTGTGRVVTPADLHGGAGIVEAGPTGTRAERDVSSRLKVDKPIIEGGHADLDAIAREIRARRKAIAACYERALKQQPTLSGKLVIRFSIAAAGTVAAVDIDEDTLGAPEVGACTRGMVLRWRFAPPAEAPVEISFPFVFQAGG